jgi:GNAT superfamily N-acetyltransferase
LLERLFGPTGVQGGCWCAFFRMTGPEFRVTDAEEHRAHVRAEVAAGKPVGLIAVLDGEPGGWVAVSPRLDNPRLARSKVAAPPDDTTAGVWSVTCFYVHRRARRQGLSKALLVAAVRHAVQHGARIVEGYPVQVQGPRAAADLYHGTVDTFAAAGFELVERRGANRALMRTAAR